MDKINLIRAFPNSPVNQIGFTVYEPPSAPLIVDDSKSTHTLSGITVGRDVMSGADGGS